MDTEIKGQIFSCKGPGRKQCSCGVFHGVRALSCPRCKKPREGSAPKVQTETVNVIEPADRGAMMSGLLGILAREVPVVENKNQDAEEWAAMVAGIKGILKPRKESASEVPEVPRRPSPVAGNGPSRGKRQCNECGFYNGVAAASCGHCGAGQSRNMTARVSAPKLSAGQDDGPMMHLADMLASEPAPKVPERTFVPKPITPKPAGRASLYPPFSGKEGPIVEWAKNLRRALGEDLTVDKIVNRYKSCDYFTRSGSDPVLASNVRAMITRNLAEINASRNVAA